MCVSSVCRTHVNTIHYLLPSHTIIIARFIFSALGMQWNGDVLDSLLQVIDSYASMVLATTMTMMEQCQLQLRRRQLHREH